MSGHSRSKRLVSKAQAVALYNEIDEFLAKEEKGRNRRYSHSDSDDSLLDSDYEPAETMKSSKSVAKVPKFLRKRRKLFDGENLREGVSSTKHIEHPKNEARVLKERLVDNNRSSLKDELKKFKLVESTSESSREQKKNPLHVLAASQAEINVCSPSAVISVNQPSSVSLKEHFLDNNSPSLKNALEESKITGSASEPSSEQLDTSLPVLAENQAGKNVFSPPAVISVNRPTTFCLEESSSGQQSPHALPEMQADKYVVSPPTVSANVPTSLPIKEPSVYKLDTQLPSLHANQADKNVDSPSAISANQPTSFSINESSASEPGSQSPAPTANQTDKNAVSPCAISANQPTSFSIKEPSVSEPDTQSPSLNANQADKNDVSSSAISANQPTSFSIDESSASKPGTQLPALAANQPSKIMELSTNTCNSSILAASTPVARISPPSLPRQMGLCPIGSNTGSTSLSGESVRKLLSNSPDGRTVLNWFKDHGSLLSRKRDIMVKIIIDDELNDDPSKLIAPERFVTIADAICQYFTCEVTQTYYIPRQKTRLKKTIRAKGKLYDKWINTRRGYRKEKFIVGRQNVQPSDLSDSSESEDDLVTESAELTWTKSKSGPLDEAIPNFKATCSVRIKAHKTSGKTISDFLRQYPAYEEDNGHILIENDFLTTYPGKENCLLQKWSHCTERIIKYAEYLCLFRPDFAAKLTKSNIQLTTEDDRIRQANALLILPLLFRSTSVKNGWKVSKTEAKDAFLLLTESTQDAVTQLARRKQRLIDHKWPEMPSAVTVNYNESVVIIGNIIYSATSPLCAVDLCCKLLFLVNSELPGDSLLPLLFLKAFVYKIEPDSALEYPCLVTLKNDLQLFPDE